MDPTARKLKALPLTAAAAPAPVAATSLKP
jgi:hypothetical protein